MPSLRTFYGLLATPPGELFQFFVWETLSEGSLPARRDLAWLALRKIPALTPDSVFRADGKVLLNAIGVSGPNREAKAERIRALVGEFKRHRNLLDAERLRAAGLVPAARALRRLSHLDPGIARRALLFSIGFPVLVIDEPISRVVNRLSGAAMTPYVVPPALRKREAKRLVRVARRWLTERTVRDVEAYRDTVLYLRHHAQQTCVAVAPRCRVCPLLTTCVFGASVATEPSTPST